MTTIAEIRELLAKADAPLSTTEIVEQLGLEGTGRDEKKPVYAAIQNGVLAGHFTRHHSSEGLAYSVAAEGTPGYAGRERKGGKPGPKPKAEAAPPPPPTTATLKPSDFDLRRRLDAIGTDLADAIADACDAEHPHALIKALVVSREAVSRAQAALPR